MQFWLSVSLSTIYSVPIDASFSTYPIEHPTFSCCCIWPNINSVMEVLDYIHVVQCEQAEARETLTFARTCWILEQHVYIIMMKDIKFIICFPLQNIFSIFIADSRLIRAEKWWKYWNSVGWLSVWSFQKYLNSMISDIHDRNPLILLKILKKFLGSFSRNSFDSFQWFSTFFQFSPARWLLMLKLWV